MTIYTKHPEENVIISSIVTWDSFPKIGNSKQIIERLALVEAQFLANYLSTLHGLEPVYKLSNNKIAKADWNLFQLKNRVDRSVSINGTANGYRLITEALDIKYPNPTEFNEVVFGYKDIDRGLISWCGDWYQHAYDTNFQTNPDCGFSMRVYRNI